MESNLFFSITVGGHIINKKNVKTSVRDKCDEEKQNRLKE